LYSSRANPQVSSLSAVELWNRPLGRAILIESEPVASTMTHYASARSIALEMEHAVCSLVSASVSKTVSPDSDVTRMIQRN